MNVAVLTGGASSERDVAIASASQVVPALRHKGHDVVVVDTITGTLTAADETALFRAPPGSAPPDATRLRAAEQEFLSRQAGSEAALTEADVLFLALHGGWGEDGTLQGLLEILGRPYTGSNPLGSAMAMDKDLSKRLFRNVGVATADWLMAPATEDQVEEALGWPVIVKPSRQGSTVGLTLVREVGSLAGAVATAAQYDDEVMIERFVPGREVTVGILGGRALSVGEIIPSHELFDYECKYTPGMSQEIFPADLEDAVRDEVQDLARSVHGALKLGGYSRVDFRLTPANELVCLEVNTLPGLTATSLLPQSARASGIEFADLCEEICRLAVVP